MRPVDHKFVGALGIIQDNKKVMQMIDLLSGDLAANGAVNKFADLTHDDQPGGPTSYYS